MDEPGLLTICAIAFAAVMLLLGFEAAIIRLIVQFAPGRRPDAQIVHEAIEQAVASRFPGARVVAVEEVTPAAGGTRAAP